jgi:hypothetical protein
MTDTYKPLESNVLAPNDSVVTRVDLGERHFESVKDHLRKYQLMQRFIMRPYYGLNPPGGTGGANSAVNYVSFDLASLLGPNPPVTSPDLTIPSSNPSISGLMSYYTPLYRAFKGGLRFKIVSEQMPTTASFAVYYYPKPHSVVSPTVTILHDYIASAVMPDPLSPVLMAGAFSTTLAPTFIANNIMTRLPVCVVNSVQKTAEFEVPFNSLYKCILNRSILSENYLQSAEFSSLGTIFVVAYPVTSPLEAVEDTANPYNTYMSLYMAFADEARFGMLYNVPSVAPNSILNVAGISISSVYPDNFTPPLNANNTLYRL